MRKKSIQIRSWIVKLIVIILVGYSAYAVIRSVRNSIFFLKKDRLNVVFYGERSVFLSLGLTDGVNYQIVFVNNNLLLQVPGGYGRYKIGSLGKLAQIEGNPTLIPKTFSSATSSFVDFYFFPKKAEVYSTAAGDVSTNRFIKILFSTEYQSNASFFERIALLTKFVNKRRRDWIELKTDRFAPDAVFSAKDFGDNYKGHFYQKRFREEAKNIRLVYSKYQAAAALNRIVEGEGIRVVDLEQQIVNKIIKEKCIIEDKFVQGQISLTSRYLKRIFGCSIKKAERGDLILTLGGKLEAEWE